jgi:hypothetical protein
LVLVQAGTPSGGQVVYPSSGTSGNHLYSSIKTTLVTEQVIAGKQSIIIQGCCVYGGADRVRHSAICYYYNAADGKAKRLNICPEGNYAD